MAIIENSQDHLTIKKMFLKGKKILLNTVICFKSMRNNFKRNRKLFVRTLENSSLERCQSVAVSVYSARFIDIRSILSPGRFPIGQIVFQNKYLFVVKQNGSTYCCFTLSDRRIEVCPTATDRLTFRRWRQRCLPEWRQLEKK